MSQPSSKRAKTDDQHEMMQKIEALQGELKCQGELIQTMEKRHQEHQEDFNTQQKKIEMLETENNAFSSIIGVQDKKIAIYNAEIQSMKKRDREESIQMEQQYKKIEVENCALYANIELQKKKLEEMKAVHSAEIVALRGELQDTEQSYQQKIEEMEKRMESLEKGHQEQVIKRKEDLIGSWMFMTNGNNCYEYIEQFGCGFLFSMTEGSKVSIKVKGVKWTLTKPNSVMHPDSGLFQEFVLGKEFEWEKDGCKHKIVFNFEEGKLFGKDTRTSDGKTSKDEIIIDSDGNLLVTLESADAKRIVKFYKVK